MPALIAAAGSWLVAHQAIAAAIGVYLGAAVAGVDLTEKVIDLERKVVATEPRKREDKEPLPEPTE